MYPKVARKRALNKFCIFFFIGIGNFKHFLGINIDSLHSFAATEESTWKNHHVSCRINASGFFVFSESSMEYGRKWILQDFR